jgi:hypothetical protein
LNTRIEQHVICCNVFLLQELMIFVLGHFVLFRKQTERSQTGIANMGLYSWSI